METAQPVQATCFTGWWFSQEQPFLKSSLNTSCYNLCQVLPFPPTIHTAKCLSPVVIVLGVWWGLQVPLKSSFFPGWTSPAAPSSHRTNAPGPDYFPGALLNSLQFINVFSHWMGQNWMQDLDQHWKEWDNPLP